MSKAPFGGHVEDGDPFATPVPLDDVEAFLSRFVAYPSEHARVAHTLWIAHCWFMSRWESTPRIAFLSPEPASGKSRALVAAVSLVTDSMAGTPSLGVLLLADLRTVFAGQDKMPTEVILTALHALDESPWASLRGNGIDARWLSRQLGKYDVKPKVIRLGYGTQRGYEAADLADPWSRYLTATSTPGPPPQESETSVTTETPTELPYDLETE